MIWKQTMNRRTKKKKKKKETKMRDEPLGPRASSTSARGWSDGSPIASSSFQRSFQRSFQIASSSSRRRNRRG